MLGRSYRMLRLNCFMLRRRSGHRHMDYNKKAQPDNQQSAGNGLNYEIG